jgi:hypothetical protein
MFYSSLTPFTVSEFYQGPGINFNDTKTKETADPPLANVQGSNLSRSRSMGAMRGGARGVGRHSWSSWNPKYGYDKDAWRKQGYSDGLYESMMNALERIRCVSLFSPPSTWLNSLLTYLR